VCPGAPFLVPGVADPIAGRLRPVLQACDAALGRLAAADHLLLITAGAAGVDAPVAHRLLPPGTLVPTTSVRRSDLPGPAPVLLPADAGRAPGAPAVNPAVATLVGASLLATVSIDTPVTAAEITGDPAEAAAALAGLTDTARRTALLVIADGSACHGDQAPGRRDDRAGGFDAALAAALAAGDPNALLVACADRGLARDLLATVDPLAVLAALTTAHPPDSAELHYAGAPLGVGYLVASWQWAES